MTYFSSISHHHGVGKHRKSFMNETLGPVGIEMLRGLKKTLDPKNIFANGNLIDVDPSTSSSNHH
jgi:alkyldihydroxyacetonephosphate synthase